MKKLNAVLIVLIAGLISAYTYVNRVEGINWFMGTFVDAKAKAQAEDKDILLAFVTSSL